MPITATFTFSFGEPFANKSLAIKKGAAAAVAKAVRFIKLLLFIFSSFINVFYFIGIA